MASLLMVPMGSYGDVLPHVVVGARLASLGHSVTIAAAALYRPLVEQRKLDFLCVGGGQDVSEGHGKAYLRKNDRKECVERKWVPHADELADLLRGPMKGRFSHAIASHNAFGLKFFEPGFRRVAILALSSYFVESYVFRKNLHERGVFSELRHGVRAYWRRWAKTRYLDNSSRGFRDWMAKRGLPDEDDVYAGMYRDSLRLSLYPSWFEGDYLRLSFQVHFTGFPLEDGVLGCMVEPQTEDLVEAFISKYQQYAVVTCGTPIWPSKAALQAVASQLHRLSIACIIVNQLYGKNPNEFGPGSLTVKMVPFGAILEHACLFVHHGGIGTIGQACASGVPQLVIPWGLDQFDNGEMIRKLGLGACLPIRRVTNDRIRRRAQFVLNDAQVARRVRSVRADVSAFDGAANAARILDRWIRQGGG